MRPEPLPCWECGSEDLRVCEGHVSCGRFDDDYALVQCRRCGNCGTSETTRAWAIVAWNANKRRH